MNTIYCSLREINADKWLTSDPRELKHPYESEMNHELHVSEGDFLLVDCNECMRTLCPSCKGLYWIDGEIECPLKCNSGRID